MNADGSAGVAIDARIGATIPALGGLAWAVLGTGLLLLVIGALLLVLAFRRRKVVYVGPPPTTPWSVPVPVDRTTAADARGDESRTAPPPAPPGG